MCHTGGCVLYPVAAFWLDGLFFSKRYDYFLPPHLSPFVSWKQGNLLFVFLDYCLSSSHTLPPQYLINILDFPFSPALHGAFESCILVPHSSPHILCKPRCIFSINCCSNQITLTEAVLRTWILRQITVSFIDEVFNQGGLIQRNEIHLASTNCYCNLVCQFSQREQNQ